MTNARQVKSNRPFIKAVSSWQSWEGKRSTHGRASVLQCSNHQTISKMVEQTGSSPMFAIFVLSLLSLALIPYTIYRFTSQGDAEDVVKPWQVWQ